MIKPINAKLVAYKYRTFGAVITVTEDGAAKDLTGFTVTAQVRDTPLSVTAMEDLTVVVTAATGVITLSLTDTETGALTAGQYYYDVRVEEDTTGDNYSYVEGIFHLHDTVTR